MASQRALNRIVFNVLLDGALAAVATPVARYIADPAGGLLHPLWFVAGGAITLLLAGVWFRMPQQYWRFAGVEELMGLVGSAVISAVLFAALLMLAGFPWPTPTFPIVHALVLIVALGAPRVVYRLRLAQRGTRRADDAQPVLLVGAGDGADLFLRALGWGQGRGYRVVGLLSLRTGQEARRIHGHSILGSVGDAAAVLARLRARGQAPTAIVVTQPDLAGPVLTRLLAAADDAGVAVRRAPRPTALMATGEGAPLELAPVAIEDLLNRPQVPLDRDGMARLVAGRRVLVTGAGGTIGAELARQLAGLRPAELALIDNGEYALWQIGMELGETHPEVVRRAFIADIRDRGRVESLFQELRPELVFHAAGLKHVPMVEANPLEGLLTNAIGTRHVADAARAVGAAAMVLISTDKAVNPSSVMGASKRLAERYCQALDLAARRGGPKTSGAGMRCVTVRFGNVLGSTGSVVPLFRRQLERGGPLTVTHPEMERYFMTVREAVGLVLQASVLGVQDAALPTGMAGGIFVLDMGEPVRIADLARHMIRLAGQRPIEGDAAGPGIRIEYTGLRPGEKLQEELFHGEEPPAPTGYPGLLMAAPRAADPMLVGRAIDDIAAACARNQAPAALALLGRMIPEFDHQPTGQAVVLETP